MSDYFVPVGNQTYKFQYVCWIPNLAPDQPDRALEHSAVRQRADQSKAAGTAAGLLFGSRWRLYPEECSHLPWGGRPRQLHLRKSRRTVHRVPLAPNAMRETIEHFAHTAAPVALQGYGWLSAGLVGDYWQTSTQVAPTSSARRSVPMRTAALVAPAAGNTSAKRRSDRSQ